MLFLLWILFVIFNGRITLEIALIGLAMTAAVYVFARRFLRYNFKAEIRLVKRLPRLLRYYGLLVAEIVKANIAVIKLILNPKKEIRPCLVSFEGKARTQWGKAALADSITLTPGTITMECTEEDGENYLSAIEDEDEFNEIGNIFEERLIDLFEFDEEDEEE